jgi:hypothetical protein
MKIIKPLIEVKFTESVAKERECLTTTPIPPIPTCRGGNPGTAESTRDMACVRRRIFAVGIWQKTDTRFQNAVYAGAYRYLEWAAEVEKIVDECLEIWGVSKRKTNK